MVAKTVVAVVEGNPISRDHQIIPRELRLLLEEIQSQALSTGPAFYQDTLAGLNALPVPDIGSTGFVLGDGTNNGVYRRGASAWNKTANLPSGFVDAFSALTTAQAAEATADDLAARAIQRQGAIPANSNVAAVTAPGVHLGKASQGYTGLPAGFDPSEAFHLFVSSPGGDAGGTGTARFVHQRIEVLTATGNRRRAWTRVNDSTATGVTTGVGAWLDVLGEIGAADLSPVYNWQGSIGGGDLNALVETGLYNVTTAMINAPAGAMVGALVEVASHSSYVRQTYHALDDPSDGWSRIIRPGAGIYYDWQRLATLPLAGKKIVILGDSITERGAWPAQVGDLTGAEVVNVGMGGTRMALHDNSLQEYYDPMSMHAIAGYIQTGNFQPLIDAANALFTFNGDDNRPQAAALAAMNWNTVDLIVSAHGTNDFSGSRPLGAATSTGNATFRGAINDIVTRILGTYPRLQLVFATPIYRARDGGSDTDTNLNGDKLTAFADAVLERAHARRVEVVDLHYTSGINAETAPTLLEPLPDGVHPLPAGDERIASRLAAALKARFA
ncbi:GDSL-type esterase/lipase family protein [Profundibacterium mesophilum]|uniref:Lipase n=1 Tax=Profundibacterium mesophilum KAUST100406-0324 TaxID=1037889 RepID=A0A921NQ59_9RHOB|nr:GDSL-type esterase/lipase family protein [Profundibacterium mesophilum]KAF0675062.1 putative lipase [Profundibacterium mesophilum KAUST100406-0324]